jgi:hypothetical protein
MNEMIAFYIGMTMGAFLLLAVLLIISALMHETWWFRYGFSNPVKKGGIEVDLACTTEEKILVKVNPKTAKETPSAIEGIPIVEVVSGDGTFEVVDGTSFWIKSGSIQGMTVFKVMGDADLGPGVSNIFDTINLTVSLPMAVSLGLTAEAPVLK